MEPGKGNRAPWRSWSDFLSWAQDFSLKKKVLGGFLGVAILVGLVTVILGMRLARHTIMEEARNNLTGDLAIAGYILSNFQENLELKVRLIAGSEKIPELMMANDVSAIRNRLAMLNIENDLDFLSVVDTSAKFVARAFQIECKEGNLDNSVVRSALGGKAAAGFRTVQIESLCEDNPNLYQRLAQSGIKSALILESAYPVVHETSIMTESRVIGAVYGGILVNNNNVLVDRIAKRLFRGQAYEGKDVGFVAIYHGGTAISSTLRGSDHLPVVGFDLEKALQRLILNNGQTEVSHQTLFGTDYISATEPVRDITGAIVGALQVSTMERPILSVIDRLVGAFLIIALFGVILMGGISYVLVNWINRPLEQMLLAAKRAAEGDLTHEVPVMARDEVGDLAATFNLMIRNLAESRGKLEEWGKQLATKVAEQTGQLNQAREQVERVKKLASLEKMADGMAHIMAHISDPLMTFPENEDDTAGATSRILVLDIDNNVLDVCQRILESEGFDVKLAGSVEEALAELEREFYDVIITDIDMPSMGGMQLLKEIKIRQPEILVILTASFKNTEVAVETVKAGAYDYLPKPFGPHQILLMVYTALQTRQMLAKTRRQHASQRAETIFQRLPVAISLADSAHRVVYSNKSFLDLARREDQEEVQGKTFNELFGVDPLEGAQDSGGSKWLQLPEVGRTAKLYNFKLPEEDLRVLMLLDVTETLMKDQQAEVFKTETINKAHQVIHQQMRVAQEIAGLLGETTAETKAALFELIKLAGEGGTAR